MGDATELYDVGIVGYGPTGGALAAYLGKAGLRVVVLEREPSIYHQPRVGCFDGETMRTFQRLGIADALLPELLPCGEIDWIDENGTRIWGGIFSPPDPDIDGWMGNYMTYQPDIEAQIRRVVDSLDNVDVLLQHEVTTLAESDSAVTITAKDMGDGETKEFRASYVVGCEGGRSIVRQTMGSRYEELGPDMPYLVVDTQLNHEMSDLPSIMEHHCDPKRPHTYILHPHLRRRWEFMVMPDDDPAELEDRDRVWQLLEPWGVTPENAVIDRAVVYTFHSLLASPWRAGRMLIAGDSAHQMPPHLGQGMCSAMRDVRNLEWKLAAVIKGEAPEGLLDTYESERVGHHRPYIEQAAAHAKLAAAITPEEIQVRNDFLQGLDDEAVQPPASLGPGLHGDVPGLAILAQQPFLEDGMRFDDRVGERFSILTDQEFLGDLPAAKRAEWEERGVAIVEDPGPGTAGVLAGFDARAIVLRPDSYVLGTTAELSALEEIVDRIPVRAGSVRA
jgi:3-(3-hydroxy-phenyl)propionate hydroxylase